MLLGISGESSGRTEEGLLVSRHMLDVDEHSLYYSTDFPTVAPFQPAHGAGSNWDAFVARIETLDADGDAVVDDADNCVDVPNQDQRDSNGDGYVNLCDPDLNGDEIVNFIDLGMMKSVFFGSDPDADLTGDGVVNFIDLGVMKSFFFGAPGPKCDQCPL